MGDLIVRLGRSVAVTTLVFFALFGISFAGTPTGPYTAYKLRVTALISTPGGAFVYFDTNHQCASNRAFVSVGRDDFKTLYSTLLAAQAAGSSVSVDLRDTSTNGSCNGAYSYIANICVGDDSGPCFSGW